MGAVIKMIMSAEIYLNAGISQTVPKRIAGVGVRSQGIGVSNAKSRIMSINKDIPKSAIGFV
jgi:hypothetical protein